MMRDRVVAVILAGGKGTRLEPLTRDRAKPAVPFGGNYRIIDFTLSNCINSGIRKILVLTQYKAMSLDRHISMGWQRLLLPRAGRVHRRRAAAAAHRRELVPGHRRRHLPEHLHHRERTPRVRGHPGRRSHLQDGLPAARGLPHRTHGRPDDRLLRCPAGRGQPAVRRHAGRRRRTGSSASRKSRPIPSRCPATSGTAWRRWAFTSSRPASCSSCSARTPPGRQRARFRQEHHPCRGRQTHRVFAYPFATRTARRTAYWRDVGTLDAYYQANMDLIAVDPLLNMYDEQWPIRTYQPNCPPPKFVFAERARPAAARPSTASSAKGRSSPAASVEQSSSGRACRINSYALVAGLDPVRGRRHRPPRQGPPGDHRQRRQDPRRRGNRLQPPARHRARLHGHR